MHTSQQLCGFPCVPAKGKQFFGGFLGTKVGARDKQTDKYITNQANEVKDFP